jgi:hypothetical protein
MATEARERVGSLMGHDILPGMHFHALAHRVCRAAAACYV